MKQNAAVRPAFVICFETNLKPKYEMQMALSLVDGIQCFCYGSVAACHAG
jgi:hypothetical protein